MNRRVLRGWNPDRNHLERQGESWIVWRFSFLVEGGESLLARYFVDGHPEGPNELGLSVSAMVWRGPEFLLMRRADNGHWGLPGGFVELGESVAGAARREVAEETGWDAEIEGLIGVYSDPGHQVVEYEPDRRVQVVNLCFRATALEAGEPTTPEETLEMGFFAPDALPEPFVPIHRVRIEDGLAEASEAAVR